MTSTALCVLGMHRSGTSAVTGVLQLLGVALGDRLMTGHKGINDLGYFEHTEIVDIHDALLAALGTRWDGVLPLPDDLAARPEAAAHAAVLRAVLRRDFGDAAVWGLKDPRMCRLLPLWRPILDELGVAPRYLLMLRAPAEVAGSLGKRDGFGTAKSACLWLHHNLAAERETRSGRRVFVTFEGLLADPRGTLERIGETLALRWPRPLEEAMGEIEAFLSPQLRHHVTTGNGADPAPGGSAAEAGWEQLADEAYHTLAALADRPDVASTVDALHDALARRIAGFDPALVDHLVQESRGRSRAETEFRRMLSSPSWMMTKPLRFLQRLVDAA